MLQACHPNSSNDHTSRNFKYHFTRLLNVLQHIIKNISIHVKHCICVHTHAWIYEYMTLPEPKIMWAIFQGQELENIKNSHYRRWRRHSHWQTSQQIFGMNSLSCSWNHCITVAVCSLFDPKPWILSLFLRRRTLVSQWKVRSVLEMVHHLPSFVTWRQAFSCNTVTPLLSMPGPIFLFKIPRCRPVSNAIQWRRCEGHWVLNR